MGRVRVKWGVGDPDLYDPSVGVVVRWGSLPVCSVCRWVGWGIGRLRAKVFCVRGQGCQDEMEVGGLGPDLFVLSGLLPSPPSVQSLTVRLLGQRLVQLPPQHQLPIVDPPHGCQ